MELFSRNHLLGTIEASSQDDVFRALAARAVELGAARSADDIVADYHEREAEASTGFGGGVAIPHSKTDNVSDAILLFARLRHPVFGYTRWNHDDYKQSVLRWFQRDGSAQGMDSEWVVYSPSVIFSVASFIRLLTAPGEGVIVCTPMYDAFYGVIEEMVARSCRCGR